MSLSRRPQGRKPVQCPGGAPEKGLGGYHAWQSQGYGDTGCTTARLPQAFARWTTTAEQVGGKTYIYYDFP